MESLESDFSLPLPQNRDAPQSDFNFPNSSEVLGRVDEVGNLFSFSKSSLMRWLVPFDSSSSCCSVSLGTFTTGTL